jgi:hypothetical protein
MDLPCLIGPGFNVRPAGWETFVIAGQNDRSAAGFVVEPVAETRQALYTCAHQRPSSLAVVAR